MQQFYPILFISSYCCLSDSVKQLLKSAKGEIFGNSKRVVIRNILGKLNSPLPGQIAKKNEIWGQMDESEC